MTTDNPWDGGTYDFASAIAAKVAALPWARAETEEAQADRYADVQGIVDAELRALASDQKARQETAK